MAIPYIKLDPQPANLSKDEIALKHTDGTLIAVVVDPVWLSNGAGHSFVGQARWIDADGTSHLCSHGQEVHTYLTHNADHGAVDALTKDAIVQELMYALLGCDVTMRTIDNYVADPKQPDVLTSVQVSEVLALQQGNLDSANIKKAIEVVSTTIDVSNVLGL